jgi:hypothetical protein
MQYGGVGQDLGDRADQCRSDVRHKGTDAFAMRMNEPSSIAS